MWNFPSPEWSKAPAAAALRKRVSAGTKEEDGMKSILEDIKTQNFKQAYLLYGEEAYLKHQYKNKLKNALLPEDDTMNFSRFEEKEPRFPK